MRGAIESAQPIDFIFKFKFYGSYLRQIQTNIAIVSDV